MNALYLIEILHQTTTIGNKRLKRSGLYLIEILHQTTTMDRPEMATPCCILSKFYIKPQPSARVRESLKGCILSKFYIKPQQRIRHKIGHSCCILSKFYIKPQLSRQKASYYCVVSYRNSTSNHNSSTYNHSRRSLYLIEILHQTTTRRRAWPHRIRLYLIEILHQTTTDDAVEFPILGCILSKFYIKPQPRQHQIAKDDGCILSKFYIKPQLPARPLGMLSVVSYRNSTSNHNVGPHID